METKTLKIGEYRGVKIYIRKLFRETFEYLILYENQLFCNQVEIQREAGKRMETYSEEDLESAVGFMLHVAQEWIDDALFKKEIYNSPKERINRLKKKVEDMIFHCKYVLSEKIDKLKNN